MPYLGNEVAPLVQALEGKELKLDADGDSSITADTDDRVDVKVGGSDMVHVTSTGLGIGTSSGSGKLTVQDNSFPKIQANYQGSAHLEMGVGGSGSGFVMTDGHFMTFNHQPYANAGSDTNLTERMRIDANGHITMPTQSAFLVTASANANFSINTTHTVVYSTEVYDQNGDFASNTFTAPVTGKYLLSQTLYFTGISSGAVYLSCYIYTSNRNYVSIEDPGTFDEGSSYRTISIAVVADMDANDTATSRYYQAGGSAISDLATDTHFSGCLLA